MCPAVNLRYIRTLPTLQRINVRVPRPSPLDVVRRRIVLKALYKHYPETFVDEVKQQRRSEVTPEALQADFMKTEQPKITIQRDQHYRKALRIMRKHFEPKDKYKPVAVPDLRYYPWNLSVSAEAPYTFAQFWNNYLRNAQQRRLINDAYPTFHNLFDVLFIQNRNLIHMIKEKHHAFFDSDGTPKPYYWVNLHARAHVVGPDDEDKIRAVFGVPKLLLFTENMFLWPMQADLLNRDPAQSPMLWGCEIMRGGWKRLRNLLLKKTENRHRTVVSADWSQFDRRALHEIIDDTHDIWHSFYDWSGQYAPTNFYPHAKTDPARLSNVWDWFTHNIKHYPVAMPDGSLLQWNYNGIASGFMETQILDSWVNGIMLLTVLSALGVDIEHKHFFLKLQGDDSLVAFSESMFRLHGKKFLDLMAKEALRRFNAKLSVDKSDIHGNSLDDVYVLGYYNKSGIAYRTDLDLCSHLLFPERTQTLEATAGTTVGLAYAGMGCSEPFYATCLDVYRFIVEEMQLTPKLDPLELRKFMFTNAPVFMNEAADSRIPPSFPDFWTTYLQNFILETRTESERQRTWPTDPKWTGGFYFL